MSKKPTRVIRHFITGEIIEVPFVNSGGGTTIFHYGDDVPDLTPVRGIPAIRTDKPHESFNAAVHRDQVDKFNKECVSGVHYDTGTGNLISTSSQSREREARRRGLSFN